MKCQMKKNEDEFTTDNHRKDRKNKYCKDCVRIINKEYRKKNLEFCLKQNRDYYWDHREEMMAKTEKWQKENAERLKLYRRNYYLENRERINTYARDYYKQMKMKELSRIYA
ncbi:MAG: hypothetical protein ACTSSH_00165 [Candidatus Heimdallarchaeota archaeon]